MNPAFFWAGPGTRDLEDEMACATQCDLNVMITGEDGLGKKSLAQWLHRCGRRATTPLVVAQWGRNLHSVGAVDRTVRRAAPHGTVHINNAESLSIDIQGRLLEHTGTAVRFITAANSSVFDRVRAHEFSDTLFYRLNTIHLWIPPLRNRPEDIPLLLRYFLSMHARAPVPRLSQEAWEHVTTYTWPGNIRELRTVAETLASRRLQRLVEPDDLPAGINH